MKFFSQLKNEKGFSLIEALIGVASIGGIALLVANMQGQVSGTKAGANRTACNSLARSVVKFVQGEAVYSRVFNYTALGASRTIPITAPPAAGSLIKDNQYFQSKFMAHNDLWNNMGDAFSEVVVSDNSASPAFDPVDLRNYRLVFSSVRSINALYNLDRTVGTWKTYPGLSAANLGLQNDLDKLGTGGTIEYDIDLIDIFSGQTVAPGAFRFVRPQGINDSQTHHLSDPVTGNEVSTNLSAGFNYVKGFNFKVKVSYNRNLDGGGTERIECETTQRFQYDIDRRPPPDPAISITSNTSVNAALVNNPAAPADITVSIGYDGLTPATTMEAGTVLLCKDRSGILEWQVNDATLEPGLIAGYPAFWNNDTVTVPSGWQTNRPVGNQGLLTTFTTNTYVPAAAPTSTDQQFNWVSCDRLSICDVMPTPTLASGNQQTENVQMSLAYVNLPINCQVNFQVIAVDAAGNASNTINSPNDHNLGDHGVISGNLTNRVVNPPVSSAFCSPAGNWNTWANSFGDGQILARYGANTAYSPGDLIGANYPSADKLSFHRGYYQAGGCCTNHNECSPFSGSHISGVSPP